MLFVIMLSLLSCRDNTTQHTSVTISDSTETVTDQHNSSTVEYVHRSKMIVNKTTLIIYTPEYCNIKLYYGNDIPDGTYNNHLYCAAGAFTGEGYQHGFKHTLIAGDHVSNGIRYNGYKCKRNTGAFVFYNGQYKFVYKDYSGKLNEAAKNKGMGFAQEMMIHNGQIVKTIRTENNKNIFRALCEKDNKLCVIESDGIVPFGQFIDCLHSIGVTEALYLDMGGWSYSWYRDQSGKIIRPFPKGKEVLTNAIVFEGAN